MDLFGPFIIYIINILEKTINTTTVSYDNGLVTLWLIVLMTHPAIPCTHIHFFRLNITTFYNNFDNRIEVNDKI